MGGVEWTTSLSFNCLVWVNKIKITQMKNYRFKIGETATLNKKPLDGQLGEYIQLGEKIITNIKDVSHIEGTSEQWVKIKEYNDWIDSTYFSAVGDKPLL